MVNTTLPIHAFRDEIRETIRHNQVVIITTETSSGKTTQVCQYALEAGYDFVEVTQPRRFAARSVAARVADECDTFLGGVVGFRTAYERKRSAQTRILFETDGVALAHLLKGTRKNSVLIIDEVHVRNLNIDVLMALARERVKTDPDFRLVLMSATIEAERLSAYFDGTPIITAPGRAFSVTDRLPVGRTMNEDIALLLKEGHDVLVFQPGKSEIRDTIDYLRSAGVDADLLPLHSELSSEEQDRCHERSNRPRCIVATDIAETSVTIDGITAVVDSGMERRIEVVNGTERLCLRSISLAQRDQRKGRAGRTAEGVYTDHCKEVERDAYPVPEINRLRLTGVVLDLALKGVDVEGLRFFDTVDSNKVQNARRALFALGCLDKDNRITKIGRQVAELPVQVEYGRMVIEAMKLGVLDDVMSIAAILKQGGIIAKACETHKEFRQGCTCWKRSFDVVESESDIMAQLQVYKACSAYSADELFSKGISVRAYYRAKETRREIVLEMKRLTQNLKSSGERDDILRAITAGMVGNLYRSQAGRYVNGSSISRRLTYSSLVSCSSKWVIGLPLDIDTTTRDGYPSTIGLLQLATVANLVWLVEAAPHLVEVREGLSPYYNSELDEVVSTTESWFNGQRIDSCERLDANHVEAAQLRREGRNLRQWSEWTDRPAISLPTEPEVGFPSFITHVYGRDVETNEKLKAYGFLSYSAPAYWQTRGAFSAVWIRDPEEARHRHQLAAMAFEAHADELRAEARRLRAAQEIDAAVLTIKPLRAELTKLCEEHYYDFPREVRDKAYNARSRHISRVEQVPTWEAEIREVLGDVRACLARIEQRANEARRLRDKANSVILDHGKTLSDALHDELATLDVDDDRLPTHMSDLEIWISRAEKLIAEAEQVIAYATQEQILTPTALSALRDKFNR